MNDYYIASGNPIALSRGASSLIRAEFSAVENGFTELSDAIPVIVAEAIALDGLATNCTSTTSNSIAVGTLSFTVETGKSYVAGMTMKFAYTSSPTNYVIGDISSYNSTTGVMVIIVGAYGVYGSGTYALWTGSQSYSPQPIAIQPAIPTGTATPAGSLVGSDDSGNSLTVNSITTAVLQAVTATSLHACALSDGNTAVFWTAGSTDLRMMIVDAAGATVLASRSIGTGLSGTQICAAQLTNGNIAVAYQAITTSYPTFKIINTAGDDVIAATSIESSASAWGCKLCALSGGGFATIHANAAGTASRYAVYTNAGAVTKSVADNNTGSSLYYTSICAMANGGFAAFGGTTTSMSGIRYGATGTSAGSVGFAMKNTGDACGVASVAGSIAGASGGSTSPFSPAIHLASDSSSSPLNTINNTVQNSCLAVSFDVATNLNCMLRASSVTVLGDGSYLAIYTAYTTSEEYPRFVNYWGNGVVIRSGYVIAEPTYGSSSYAMYAMPNGVNGFSLVWAAANRNIKFAHVRSGHVLGISTGQFGSDTKYNAYGSATVASGNMLNVGGAKVNYTRQGLKVVI